jgi:hypothetical protein
MKSLIFLYLGSLLPIIWGIAHLLPTEKVVQAFGVISEDNKRIITMEWIIEGIALIFIGILTGLVTFTDPKSPVSFVVYWASFGVLNTLSVVSLFTGFKVTFIPFKLCPFIFTVSSLLIIFGCYQ